LGGQFFVSFINQIDPLQMRRSIRGGNPAKQSILKMSPWYLSSNSPYRVQNLVLLGGPGFSPAAMKLSARGFSR
jgi:hypothetical protein